MAKSKIGRNDLCLCGSGKKYKNCCMVNNNEKLFINAQKDKFDKAEKEMIEIIMKYLNSNENKQDYDAARGRYFGNSLSEISMNDAQFNFFISWYINHCNSNIISKIIEKEKKNIASDVIKLLQNLNHSGLYFYKIIDIANNKVVVKNLHNSNVLEIIDPVLEKNVNINDTIYTRIYHMDKLNRLFGGSIIVPKLVVEELLDQLKTQWEHGDNQYSYEAFLQINALEIIKKLNAYILDDEILYNEENELLQYCVVTYAILERDKCNFILEGIKELTHKQDDVDILYQWIKKDKDNEFVMGEITISQQQLQVETDSFERKENLQKLVEGYLKDTIEFVDEQYYTISQLQQETGGISDDCKNLDQIERLLLANMKNEYRASIIKEAILLAKAHKSRLRKIKPEGVAAAMEYIVATQAQLPKTQKDIAVKYNVSAATVGKWAKDINENAIK